MLTSMIVYSPVSYTHLDVYKRQEARRVLPVVQALAKAGAVVSIDTRHVEVAKAAVRVGASICLLYTSRCV